MADSNECAVCKKMIKSKHKLDKFYRIGFWILLIFSIIISILYFAEVDLFRHTKNNVTVENNTDVDITDGNSNSVNIDNGSYHIS